MKKLIASCAASAVSFLLSAAPALPFHYQYPDQPGVKQIQESDPGLTALTDQNWETGARCKDGTLEWLIDLTLDEPQEVSTLEMTIQHVDLFKLSKNSHPLRVQLYVAGENGEWEPHPRWVFPVPFEATEYQTVMIPFPAPLQAKQLRLGLIPATNWVKLVELKLRNNPLPEIDALKHYRPERIDTPPAGLPVPVEQLEKLDYKPSEILGVCGHIMHTDFFFPGQFPGNWKLPLTIDSVIQGNFGWVREPLYSPYFLGNPDNPAPGNQRPIRENRAQIDRDLALYDRLGVKVLLTPMSDASHRNPEGLNAYCDWLVELVKKHPSIQAIEFENEPNIGSVSPESYAFIVRQMAPKLREALPDMPLILGSLALWGMRNRYWEEKRPPEQWAMAWFEELLQQDVLKYVDGVSFHPYRWGTAEGGTPIESPYDENGFRKELHRFSDLIARYNKENRKIGLYITEIGFSARSNETLTGRDLSPVVAEQLQADFGGRTLMIALDEAVKGLPIKMLLWYDLKEDPVWSFESGFGLVGENNLYRKPAYAMLRKLSSRCGNPSEYLPAGDAVQVTVNPQWVATVAWRKKNSNELVVAFWRMQQFQQFDRDFADRLSITLPPGVAATTVELDAMHETMPRGIGFSRTQTGITVPVWVTTGVNFLTVKWGASSR